jgi:hypothetical protein
MIIAMTVTTVVALLPPVQRVPVNGDPTPELRRIGFTRPSPSSPTGQAPPRTDIEAVPDPSDRPRPSPVPTLTLSSAGPTILPGLSLPGAGVAVTPENLLPAVSSAVQAVRQGTAGEIPAVP